MARAYSQDLRERANETAESAQESLQDSFDTTSRRMPNGMGMNRTTIE